MLRSDAIKNNSLYECYCKVEDDYEKKWAKKDFYSFVSNQNNIFILSCPKPAGYLKARATRDEKIGRAHVRTPVTSQSRMPSSA